MWNGAHALVLKLDDVMKRQMVRLFMVGIVLHVWMWNKLCFFYDSDLPS
jgi:hypothetical protein